MGDCHLTGPSSAMVRHSREPKVRLDLGIQYHHSHMYMVTVRGFGSRLRLQRQSTSWSYQMISNLAADTKTLAVSTRCRSVPEHLMMITTAFKYSGRSSLLPLSPSHATRTGNRLQQIGRTRANPIYAEDGITNNIEEAVAFCKTRCEDSITGCAGFFFQNHQNGHEHCGFYVDPANMHDGTWVQHGHQEGSRVCELIQE
jgi:hypothetical protein